MIRFRFASLALFGIAGGSLREKCFGVSHHPVTSSLFGITAGLQDAAPCRIAPEPMEIVWTRQLVGLLLAMIREGEVSKASALFFLVPLLAAAVACIVLDEIMPPLAWFGMIVAGPVNFMATTQKRATA